MENSKVQEGTVTVFMAHTSASLIIYENADPSVRRDFEYCFNRLIPEGDPHYQHQDEGPDDTVPGRYGSGPRLRTNS